jgi:hypothetical protein
MSRTYLGTTLGAPTPTHTMTESAEAARQAMREQRVERIVGKLVAKHEKPSVPSGGWPVPKSAQQLRLMAEALDYEVKILHGFYTMNAGKSNETKAPAVQVQGLDVRRGYGFRAVWVRGRAATDGCVWYERGVTPRTGQPMGVTALLERIGR